MLMGIIITALVYSAILAIVDIYKDLSDVCSELKMIDIIVAGPVLWVLLALFVFVINPIRKHISKDKQNTEQQAVEAPEDLFATGMIGNQENPTETNKNSVQH